MTTESDRELLELAAKAAGIPIIPCTCRHERWPFKHDEARSGKSGHWNPLEDDGDALRLESALSLDVRWQGQHVIVGRTYGDAWQEPFYLHDGDKLAARRYAAVRASAAIARATHKEQT